MSRGQHELEGVTGPAAEPSLMNMTALRHVALLYSRHLPIFSGGSDLFFYRAGLRYLLASFRGVLQAIAILVLSTSGVKRLDWRESQVHRW